MGTDDGTHGEVGVAESVFFVKQKTAYEIKECDWSSDVCSSDLATMQVACRSPMGRCVKMGKVYHRVWRIIAALLPAGAALWLLGTTPRRELPLWPGARYTVAQRDRAIERGMDFLYHRMACNPEYFKRWGGDIDRKSKRLNSSHIPLSRMP